MAKKTESTFTIKAIDKTQKVLAGIKRGLKTVSVAAVATVAATATAIAGLTAQGLDNVDQLAKAAGRLDLGVAQYQALQHAASKADVSVGDLESAFGRMRREIGEGDKVFAELGLSVDSLLKMKPDEQFQAVAGALAKIENPTVRAAKAQEIFGRSAQKLNNLLRDGGESISAAEEMFKELGIAATEQGAAGVEMANDAIADLKKVGEGVSNTLAEQFAPAITVVAEALLGAGGGGGLGNAIANVSRFIIDGLVTAVGMAMDAWHNFKIALKAGEVGLLTIMDTVSQHFPGIVKGATTFIETLVNNVLTAVNSVIREVNDAFDRLPKWMRDQLGGFGKIPEIKFRLKLETGNFADGVGGALADSRGELDTLLAAQTPSEAFTNKFNDSIFDVQNRSYQIVLDKRKYQATDQILDEAEQTKNELKTVEDDILKNSKSFVDARNTTLIDGSQQAFDGLLSMSEQFAGQQSGLYKTMFAASKAFAIAQSVVSITQGIANAAALPFPSNLPAMGTVVAATAGLIGQISSTVLSFEGGGKFGIRGNRSGGVDGRGGVPFVAHPGENVQITDLQRGNQQQGGNLYQYFTINGRLTEAEKRETIQVASELGAQKAAGRFAETAYRNPSMRNFR